MDNKIQKLCKRLNKFTLEEISLIAELEESETEKILNNLIIAELLKKNGIMYLYTGEVKAEKQQKRLPLIFQCHSQETVNMLIKCFCADIPSTKACLILKPQKNRIWKFNQFFRKTIYEMQRKELLQHFLNQPK